MIDEHSEIQTATDQGTGVITPVAPVSQTPTSVDVNNPFSESQSGSSEEKGDVKEGEEQSQDYTIQFPDIVPPEVASLHTNTFKEVGIEADKAQKVIDALACFEEQSHKQQIEGLQKSLEEDKRELRRELGSDYDTRVRDISRYFHEEKISDSDVQALVTEWGFHKTFQFFDRYAQMNKESSAGDTFARAEGSASSSVGLSKTIDSPEFWETLKSGDPEAGSVVKQWAKQQAISQQ